MRMLYNLLWKVSGAYYLLQDWLKKKEQIDNFLVPKI